MAFPDDILPSTPWSSIPKPSATDMNSNITAPLNAIRAAMHSPPDQVLSFIPSGNLDTSASTTATWFTVGALSVPSWATIGYVDLTMEGPFDTVSTNNCTWQIKIGSIGGAVNRRLFVPVAANGRAPSINRKDAVTGLTPSSTPNLIVAASFVSGSVARVDTQSTITAHVWWGA